MRRAAIALALVIDFAAGAAFADEPRVEAKRLRDLGTEAYQRKDFAGALEHFRKAHQIYPSPALDFNLALALEGLGSAPEAIEHYQRFLGSAAGIDPTARAHATARVSALEKRVGTVTLVGAAGANVSIDRQPRGKTPLPFPLRVAPGAHQLAIARPGFRSFVRELILREGELQRVDFALVPDPLSTGTPSWSWRHRGPLSAGAVTLLLAATGAALAGGTWAAYADASSTCAGLPEPSWSMRDCGGRTQTAERLSQGTNAIFAVAGVAAVITVGLILHDVLRRRDRRAGEARPMVLLASF